MPVYMVGIYTRAVCQLETDAKRVGNKCPPYPPTASDISINFQAAFNLAIEHKRIQFLNNNALSYRPLFHFE